MKQEWKKLEKNLYGTKQIPACIEVPRQNYIMIQGKGNPNHQDFSNRVATLYALAYAIKMGYKALAKQQNTDIEDYVVYPLEGIWGGKIDTELVKENLEYTIMIRQPDFITKDMVLLALEKVKQKKPSLLFNEIYFDTMCDGKCIEILHVSSFDAEPESFSKMDAFMCANGYQRTSSGHREIYLNNANRTLKSKLKTILRYQVEEVSST